jgi:hypothetical protein
MDIPGSLQLIASLAEVFIALIAIRIAVQKKKTYGWFIAVTFGLFVVFNIIRVFALGIPAELDALVFLLAGVSMLCAVWLMWKES